MRLDLLAALVGVLIAVQARANGELASKIHNVLEAALISFGSGLLILLVITFFHSGIRIGIRKLRNAVSMGLIAKWKPMAGVIGGIAMAVQAKIVPITGVAIYAVAVISGQTAASLLIDRLGLNGGTRNHISFRRTLAAVFTIFAVIISVWDRIDAKNISVFAIVLGVFSGAIIGLQRALNANINQHTSQSYATSLLNFIFGTAFLVLLFAAAILTHHSHLTSLQPGPWWMYLGGITGVVYIALASIAVQHLGVLTFTLYSVGGQLIGSLLLDILLPSAGVHVGFYLVVGILMTFVGVAANSERSRSWRKSS